MKMNLKSKLCITSKGGLDLNLGPEDCWLVVLPSCVGLSTKKERTSFGVVHASLIKQKNDAISIVYVRKALLLPLILKNRHKSIQNYTNQIRIPSVQTKLVFLH